MTSDRILELARRGGAQQAEVFGLGSEETPVSFEANRLKEINSRHSNGVALRVIVDGRIGFASSTRPDDVEELVEAALETAPFGPGAKFDFPVNGDLPTVKLFDPETERLSLDEMIQTGQSLIDAVRKVNPELLCDAGVRRVIQSISVANSNGGECSYRRSYLSISLNGTLIRGTDMLFVGDADVSCRPDVDAGAVEASVTRQLENSRRTASVRTGEMPVVFTPLGFAGALLMPLVVAFSGRMVHLGQSPLVDSLGKEMYDKRFTLWDYATRDYQPGSRPFDDEGVPSQPFPLIEEGVVRNFMYDLQSAGLAGTKSTGSADRSLASQPSVGASCLLVRSGETAFEEMVSSVKEGLVVDELMGAGQGNVMGGDFSGNVLLGYKIENGEIVGRVKDTIVAGNVHEAFRRLEAVGFEGRWVGGGTVYSPPFWFDRLSVSSGG